VFVEEGGGRRRGSALIIFLSRFADCALVQSARFNLPSIRRNLPHQILAKTIIVSRAKHRGKI
jgi:hypothetical protein